MPEYLIANCKLRIANCKFGTSFLFFVRCVVPIICAVMWPLFSNFAVGQDLVSPGTESLGMDHGVAPMTNVGGGDFFSQDLGTILRLRYNTESYGQNDQGNFDIGTMQVLSFDDSIVFFDGQITLNDVQGVGFNLGVGYRWLSFPPYALDTGRVEGISVWADGTSTEASNFFPQVGLSYESLGEMWDLRANGYIPVGEQDQVGRFRETGVIGFQGNSISELTRAVQDSSFYAGEVELARRLGAERDAWAFAGPYFLANDHDDTIGYRAGLRGYAYPDLLLQFAVSDDEIFHTNATFSVMWFVGRTRTDFRPACGVPDRMREPVLRNDYVVLAQSTVLGGNPLTQPDGSALRVVHVNSEAPDGGDGSFERPLNNLANIHPNSQPGDIVLAWAGSNFDNQAGAVLRNNQRFLGEGDGFQHTVATAQRGTILIPETSPGARGAARPVINNATGNAVTLANSNEVTNFTIQGGTQHAIFAGSASNGGATLRELAISNTGGSALRFEDITSNITIDDVSVTGGTNFALDFVNVGSAAVVTLTDFEYDGESDAMGAMRFDNFDGTFNASTSTLAGGTLQALRIINGSAGTFTLANTVTIENIGNTVVDIEDFSGRLTLNSGFENDTGFAVSIVNMDGTNAQAIFNGDITNNDAGIRVTGSNRAFIQFLGDVTLTTGNNDAIFLSGNNNTNTDINFNGDVVITTVSGRGFVAENNGGELTVASTNNRITTGNDIAVDISDSAVSTLGVNFAEINVGAGALHAIRLENNTGGPIVLGRVGDDAGESGTIAATTDNAIVIENSANVTVSGLRLLSNPNPVSGVRVVKNTTGTQTVNLNDLEINGGAFGVNVLGGSGTLNMTINDTAINTPTDVGVRIDNVDAGTIQVNSTTIDGNNVTAQAGIFITDSNATINFNSLSQVREVVGTAYEVSGGSGNLNMSGAITNTAGNSVHIHNVTGGSVVMTGVVNDTGTGITIEDNTGGVINLSGTYTLNTGANDAVEILNNTGADVTMNALTINTTSGAGFRAEGGGDLTVLGATNTITSGTGTGLVIDGMNIVGQANFQSVSVNGATNGIVLNDVTGGTVTIGNQGGATNSGGFLQNTTGDAIQITNVQNAVLNHIRIQGAGGQGVAVEHTAASDRTMNITIRDLNLDSSTGTGVSVSAASSETFNFRLLDGDLEENVAIAVTGTGQFSLLVDNTDITTSGNTIAFSLEFSGGPSGSGDLTFRNGNNFMADDASALFIDAFGASSKTLRLLVENSEFSNNSLDAAVDILSRGNTLFNATLRGNTFENVNAGGSDFDITADGAMARMRLNLGGDDVSEFNIAGGVGEFNLIEDNGADFDVFDRDDTFAGSRNTGTVVPQSPAGIVNPAAFDDLPTAPPLPTVP